MTRLTKAEVEHVAKLSYLELAPEELERHTKDLASIVRHIEKLNELDTTGVQPTYQVNTATNAMREDEVRESLNTSELLKMAPEHDDHSIQVPKIINLEP